MERPTFAEMTDRSRLDRLRGEILAFVSDFENNGYSNLEIARELVAASFNRASREEKRYIEESFYHHVVGVTTRLIGEMNALGREMATRVYKQTH
jgi:hypothetical protein